IERSSHLLMHSPRFVPFDEAELVPVPFKQFSKIIVRNPREEARIGDLVTVEMKDRQDAAVALRVKKFVAMPAGRQWTGLRFAIADDAGHDQTRIVESGPISMRQGVSHLSTFM